MTTQAVSIDQFLEEGVLIRVSVFGTTMFKERIGWAQLGVDPSDVDNRRVKQAHHILSPEAHSMLHVWSGKMRGLVREYSVDTSAVDALMGGHWHWVANASLPDFQDAWDRLMLKRDDIVMHIITHLDEYREEARDYWREQAAGAWAAIRSRIGGAAFAVEGRIFDATEQPEFIQYCVDAAIARFPTEDKIRNEIHAGYTTFEPFSNVQRAEAREQVARADQAQSEAAISRMRAEDLAFTKQTRRQAIRQAQITRAQALVSAVKDPVQESLEKALATVADEVHNITDSYQRNGYLNWTLVEKAKKLRKLWSILGGDMADQDRIKTLLIDLERFIDACPDRKYSKDDARTILAALGSIGSAVEKEAADIAAGIHKAEKAAASVPDNADEILAALITAVTKAPGIEAHHRRLRNWMNDLSPDTQRANNLLELSVLERIPADLERYRKTSTFPKMLFVKQLATRMVASYSIEPAVAEWVVTCWDKVLDQR